MVFNVFQKIDMFLTFFYCLLINSVTGSGQDATAEMRDLDKVCVVVFR